MNQSLWKAIQDFDLDKPMSEYGFSVRLAKENYWTRNFTEKAILEYKKFMYLAATSDYMVSPSEIIDVVWHQHLIFTQSYQEFCQLIGKQIQHIPSIHNRADFQKFQMAKARTKELYENTFGQQPNAIWNYSDMYESLNLTKADYKIRSVIIAAILVFLASIVPSYFTLRPLYVDINNPYFLLLYIAVILFAFVALEIYNKSTLKKIVMQFNSDSFVFDLQPTELIYMRTKEIGNIVNGYFDKLITSKHVKVCQDYRIEKVSAVDDGSKEAFLVDEVLDEGSKTFYWQVQNRLISKPWFSNIENCVSAFQKYFSKSKKFASVFYLNLGILSMTVMLGTIRLITGLLRDKPVFLISFFIILLIGLTILYLRRLTMLIITSTVPVIYEQEILPHKNKEPYEWEWKYFLLGNALLTAPFITLVNQQETNWSGGNGSSGGDSSSSSCGSSCGSSCSSCGGCGGGD